VFCEQYEASTGSSGCASCPAGSYCASMGLSAVTGTCGQGTYSAAGASSCASCAAGRYQSAVAQSTCNACLSGQVAATPRSLKRGAKQALGC
jgi:hypothetical protein